MNETMKKYWFSVPAIFLLFLLIVSACRSTNSQDASPSTAAHTTPTLVMTPTFTDTPTVAISQTPEPVFTEILTISPAPTLIVEGTPMPFERIASIDESRGYADYDEYEAKIILVDEADDLVSYAGILPFDPGVQQGLVETDFDRFIVLIVLQGRRPSGGYRANIQELTKWEDRISVYTTFNIPQPFQGVSEMETSPYDLIRVDKNDLPDNVIFELIVDQVEVNIGQ